MPRKYQSQPVNINVRNGFADGLACLWEVARGCVHSYTYDHGELDRAQGRFKSFGRFGPRPRLWSKQTTLRSKESELQ